jgi:hypothetical protein
MAIFRFWRHDDPNVSFDIEAGTFEEAMEQAIDDLGWGISIEDAGEYCEYCGEDEYDGQPMEMM